MGKGLGESLYACYYPTCHYLTCCLFRHSCSGDVGEASVVSAWRPVPCLSCSLYLLSYALCLPAHTAYQRAIPGVFGGCLEVTTRPAKVYTYRAVRAWSVGDTGDIPAFYVTSLLSLNSDTCMAGPGGVTVMPQTFICITHC